MKSTSIIVKSAIIVISLIGLIGLLIYIGPYPQDPSYHQYADTRPYFGIPHFWNVITNLLFGLIGILGVGFLVKSGSYQQKRFIDPAEKIFYYIFFLAIFSLVFTSSYYHWSPDHYRLAWDRYSIAISFMSFVSAMIAERSSLKVGLIILLPLILLGMLSVYCWIWSEHGGYGDLRFYIFVQVFPIILIPLLIWLFPAKYTGIYYLWLALFSYLIAKVFEVLDDWSYSATNGFVSGHTIKHLFVTVSCFFIFMYLCQRRVISANKNGSE